MAYWFERQRIQAYGDLLQQDYYDYLEKGRPLEDAILEEAAGGDNEANVNKAMQASDQAYDNAALQTNQQLARYGIRLNENQRQAKARQYGVNKVLARVNSANNTRYSESERQEQARDLAMGIGSDLYANALSKLGYAAEGAGQEIQFQEARKAAKKSRRMQTVGTALGTAAAVAISDKKKKQNISDNDNRMSLRKILGMKTKNYEYKPETGRSPGQRTGVMEDQAPEEMRATTATGEKGVDLASWVGELTGAVQELAQQQDQLRMGLKRKS